MNRFQIWNELKRIRSTSNDVGNIEGLDVCENCDEEHWHIFNDLQTVLIPKTEIDNIFRQLPNNCGLRTFWNQVRNNSLCLYSEHIPN